MMFNLLHGESTRPPFIQTTASAFGDIREDKNTGKYYKCISQAGSVAVANPTSDFELFSQKVTSDKLENCSEQIQNLSDVIANTKASLIGKINNGLNVTCIGDSTESSYTVAGIYGWDSYINSLGWFNKFGLSLVYNGDDFIKPNTESPYINPLSTNETLPSYYSLSTGENVTYTAYRCKTDIMDENFSIYYEVLNDTPTLIEVEIKDYANNIIVNESFSTLGDEIFGVYENRIIKKKTIVASTQSKWVVSITNTGTNDIKIFGTTRGKGVSFTNLGYGGTTLTNDSYANESRVDTDTVIQKVKDLDTDVVFIGYGTNDSKTGVTTKDAFKTEYQARIDELKTWKENIMIVLCVDQAGKEGSEYIYNVEYNEIIRTLALENKLILVDFEKLFFYNDDNFYNDNIHPSNIGNYAQYSFLCNLFGIKKYNEENTYVTY